MEAFTATNQADQRFHEVEEMTSAVMRFPGQRLAAFTCSFGAADVSSYRIVGTSGDLRVEPAYGYAGKLKHFLTIDCKETKKTFSRRDQFAPEIEYLSRCILEDKEPEPSVLQGLIDVRIIQAIYESAQTGRLVKIGQLPPGPRPSMEQEIYRLRVSEPQFVHAQSPSD